MFTTRKIYLLTLLFLAPHFSWAQTPLPVGDHEALLGNTGVARMGSAAAALYNPAGLATLEQTQVSASGTLFQNSVRDLSGSYSAHADTFQSIPTQLSTTGKTRGGYHYAFSVFTAEAFDYAVVVNADIGSGLGVAPVHVKSTGNSLLVGPSIGMPYKENFFWGVSLFLQKDDNYENAVARVDTVGAGGQLHLLRQSEVKTSTYELLPVIGASWKYSPDTLLGLRIKLPLVPLFGHRSTDSQAVGYFLDNSNNLTDLGEPSKNVKENAKTMSPAEVAVGFARHLENEWRVYGDVGYSLKMKWRPTAGAGEEEFVDSLSVSLGAEHGPLASTWAGGVFYRQNNVRHTAGEVASFTGVTFGYLNSTEHFDSGIGGSYMFGSGSADGITNKLSNVGLLVSSTYKF